MSEHIEKTDVRDVWKSDCHADRYCCCCYRNQHHQVHEALAAAESRAAAAEQALAVLRDVLAQIKVEALYPGAPQFSLYYIVERVDRALNAAAAAAEPPRGVEVEG